MLKQRIITAIVLGLLLVAAMFKLPPLGWAALVLVVAALGIHEWGRLAKLTGVALAAYVLLGVAALGGAIACAMADTDYSAWMKIAIYGLAALFWLTVAPFWLWRGWRPARPALAAAGWLVLIPCGLAMNELHAKSPWLLLFFLGLVWIADTAAYFSGKRFGKRKLAPTISPGKTWEGAIGAMLAVSVYVTLVQWVQGERAYQAFLFALPAAWALVAISVEGDLFESAIKRQAGAKDSGSLLPGHGGMLDRIDALTSTLPLPGLVLALSQIWMDGGCG